MSNESVLGAKATGYNDGKLETKSYVEEHNLIVHKASELKGKGYAAAAEGEHKYVYAPIEEHPEGRERA